MNGLTKVTTLAVLTGGLLLAANASQAAQDCKPSKWGAKDEIGAANYVTPEQVLMAVKLVKKGESHPLGIGVEPKMPAYPPRSFSLQIVQPGQHNGRSLMPEFGWDVVYNDDLAQLWFGTGPQLDGLGHMGESGVYYNCNKAVEFVNIAGLKKLGVDKIPPLIGRGVMVDMAKHFGVETMQSGQVISSADIKAAAMAQGVEFRQGDVVLFHTGWTDALLESDPDAWVSGEPGQSEAVARYLAGKNVVAVGADTWGLDVLPSPDPDRPFQGHVILLKENGIYILETMNTGPLVRDKAFEFMFVLGQAKVRGAVQMIINPIAIR